MKCCSQCEGIEKMFDADVAAKELEDYRKQGPSKTTRLLMDTLKTKGINGLTLLDIGGGVGAIQHTLLQVGVRSAVNIDASTAYMNAAKAEAERLGQADRVSYHHGNFVTLAPDIEPADIVTLDRVICCYPDAEALVGLSAARAKRFYGVVFPRDAWWMKLVRFPLNAIFWLQRNSFRFFVHPTGLIDSIARANGLERCFKRNKGIWQVIVYEK